MIMIHNGKSIGVNVHVIAAMTLQNFISAHKHLNFTKSELEEIYRQIKEMAETH